jgi:hypothetical protein
VSRFEALFVSFCTELVRQILNMPDTVQQTYSLLSDSGSESEPDESESSSDDVDPLLAKLESALELLPDNSREALPILFECTRAFEEKATRAFACSYSLFASALTRLKQDDPLDAADECMLWIHLCSLPLRASHRAFCLHNAAKS